MRPIVTDRVAWSVGPYVGLSRAKKAEPIKMPFELRTQVGPRNHVLDSSPHAAYGKGQFEGEGRPIVKYRHTPQSSVQKRLNGSRCHLG